jgi:FKBP-type peptidyl-prolyl cis-trans isomerase SlyD
MIVEDKKVVSFRYTLSNSDGEQLESNREAEPMTYLHGFRNIIPGLEKAMEGKSADEEFEVTLQPEEAYGERDEARMQRIPAKRFKNARQLKPGQAITLETKRGPMQAIVSKVGRFNVDIDVNHPLAGQILTFEVKITDIRDASPEELSHGHAHGPGGVQH